MRETYWNCYKKIAYQFFYYKRFQIFLNAVNNGITAFCGLTALSSVAAWGLWKSYPLLWSFLICMAQLVQAIFPKLPYNDMLCSTKFMICSLDKLLLSIRHSWLEIDVYDYTDEHILEIIAKYEAQYSKLVSQFYSGTYLPEIRYCEKKAEEECIAYFNTYYPQ